MPGQVENTAYHPIGKLYVGMTKESIRADIDAAPFKSQQEREKAYNKQIQLFNYANTLVPEEVDDFISEKEIEEYNEKEKTNKTWKNITLTALGISTTIAAAFILKKVRANKLEQVMKTQGVANVHNANKIFDTPSAEKLEQMMKEQGLGYLKDTTGEIQDKTNGLVEYITDNNSLFLEDLIKRFPLKEGDKFNAEVQKRMLYLQNINHTQFTDKRKFLDKFLKDVDMVENIKATDGSLLYGEGTYSLYSKKAILQAKYNDADRYSELTGLLKLYHEGKVPRHLVQIFFPEAHFHNLPKGDMIKLINGEHYFPELAELTESAISKVEFGEVFSVGEKMFVKTKEGYKALNFDKATYEKLFPAIERYAISQNANIANCGKIASWNAMIKNPNSRIEIYKLFEQTPSGVKVSIPSLKFSKEFNWNDLSELQTGENLNGSLGHKMAELTHDLGCYGKLDVSSNAKPELVTNITGLPAYPEDSLLGVYIKHRHSGRQSIIIDDFVSKHSNGVYISGKMGNDLNNGLIDMHCYSATNLGTTMQNPFNCIEEISKAMRAPTLGCFSIHDYI